MGSHEELQTSLLFFKFLPALVALWGKKAPDIYLEKKTNLFLSNCEAGIIDRGHFKD